MLSETGMSSVIVTVCSFCNLVKDNEGGWNRTEISESTRENLLLSHGLCPDCARINWPDLFPR